MQGMITTLMAIEADLIVGRAAAVGYGAQQRAAPAANATVEERVQLYRRMIVEEVFTLRCPRCRVAFIDYTGCDALTCGACAAKFCAICLKDCGAKRIHIFTRFDSTERKASSVESRVLSVTTAHVACVSSQTVSQAWTSRQPLNAPCSLL